MYGVIAKLHRLVRIPLIIEKTKERKRAKSCAIISGCRRFSRVKFIHTRNVALLCVYEHEFYSLVRKDDERSAVVRSTFDFTFVIRPSLYLGPCVIIIITIIIIIIIIIIIFVSPRVFVSHVHVCNLLIIARDNFAFDRSRVTSLQY